MSSADAFPATSTAHSLYRRSKLLRNLAADHAGITSPDGLATALHATLDSPAMMDSPVVAGQKYAILGALLAKLGKPTVGMYVEEHGHELDKVVVQETADRLVTRDVKSLGMTSLRSLTQQRDDVATVAFLLNKIQDRRKQQAQRNKHMDDTADDSSTLSDSTQASTLSMSSSLVNVQAALGQLTLNAPGTQPVLDASILSALGHPPAARPHSRSSSSLPSLTTPTVTSPRPASLMPDELALLYARMAHLEAENSSLRALLSTSRIDLKRMYYAQAQARALQAQVDAQAEALVRRSTLVHEVVDGLVEMVSVADKALGVDSGKGGKAGGTEAKLAVGVLREAAGKLIGKCRERWIQRPDPGQLAYETSPTAGPRKPFSGSARSRLRSSPSPSTADQDRSAPPSPWLHAPPLASPLPHPPNLYPPHPPSTNPLAALDTHLLALSTALHTFRTTWHGHIAPTLRRALHPKLQRVVDDAQADLERHVDVVLADLVHVQSTVAPAGAAKGGGGGDVDRWLAEHVFRGANVSGKFRKRVEDECRKVWAAWERRLETLTLHSTHASQDLARLAALSDVQAHHISTLSTQMHQARTALLRAVADHVRDPLGGLLDGLGELKREYSNEGALHMCVRAEEVVGEVIARVVEVVSRVAREEVGAGEVTVEGVGGEADEDGVAVGHASVRVHVGSDLQ